MYSSVTIRTASCTSAAARDTGADSSSPAVASAFVSTMPFPK
uniref:Uncharacterized protein n=1 Tax=Arundo donax TaxID=35708 RepID=A0A0A9G8T1_ARUDO